MTVGAVILDYYRAIAIVAKLLCRLIHDDLGVILELKIVQAVKMSAGGRVCVFLKG